MPPKDQWLAANPPKKPQWKDIPLSRHLGLKKTQLILILWAPPGFMERLGEEYAREGRYDVEPDLLHYDYIHSFIPSKIVLESMLPMLVGRLDPHGILWISWRTKRTENSSELDRRSVRELCAAHGLLETKTLKIDEEWSALKFIHDPNKPIRFIEKREVLRFGL